MPAHFAFGEFELDVAAYELRRSGARIHLERIPMECLVLLVQRAGSLVSRNEIRQALWDARVFVDHEAAINTALRKVRLALDDPANAPRFVETAVGKGYRFIAHVERSTADIADAPAMYCRLTRGRREIALLSDRSSIGRDPGADLHVDHPAVSRRHAILSLLPGRVVIEDLKSRNGTFVNGQRISEPVEVTTGTVIAVGPVAFKVRLDAAPRSTQPLLPESARSLRKRDR